ncbi:DUF305 domain-containing protein [Streptomyces rishiriensis]|uniref:Uncharacterized protein (DUF305 family) n=1 Tax=Streptomyces rishiriensis TaxID=68264 RepID=A0ABU0NI47_STRRH|nr:DUF305 domain-containing protein [Streptomyces rishiriensis]MDQ0578746.1 uncharacterized protein (DUF305 family) [Streptomyces rishiriensis]
MQLRRYLLILRSVCALAMALLAVGCTTQPTAGTPPATAFNATDTAWIQLMIPMDERAQLLTRLAPSRDGDTALAALAAETALRLRDNLVRLRDLLELSGIPDSHPHEGHDMPGMVSLDTLERAGTATGQAFDRILNEALRAHLTQSRMLCAGERTQGHAAKAKDLAAAIARSTAEQISWLDRLRPAAPAASDGSPPTSVP